VFCGASVSAGGQGRGRADVAKKPMGSCGLKATLSYRGAPGRKEAKKVLPSLLASLGEEKRKKSGGPPGRRWVTAVSKREGRRCSQKNSLRAWKRKETPSSLERLDGSATQ